MKKVKIVQSPKLNAFKHFIPENRKIYFMDFVAICLLEKNAGSDNQAIKSVKALIKPMGCNNGRVKFVQLHKTRGF